MRERLVAALVGMTLAVIALYGVPRAYYLGDFVERQEERKVERSVQLLAHVLAERTADDRPLTRPFLHRLLNEAEGIAYSAPDGTVVVAGVAPEGHATIERTAAVPGGGSVTLVRSRALIDQRVAEALTPLVLIGLALTGLSAGAGFWLARRLSRPFQQLATAAGDLGAGRFDVDVPPSRVPEAERIRAALRSSGVRLGELVRREREFSVNASHQLRTPITALRLELEDLAQWPETTPAVAAELRHSLEELDRLDEAVADLLHLARGHRRAAAEDVELVGLVARVVERWRPRAAAEGRDIVLESQEVPRARLTPGPIEQVLDLLLENACRHGTGSIHVSTGHGPSYLSVQVADEGNAGLDGRVFRRGVSGTGGTGVGLAVATELAESMGGRLDLGSGPTTSFVLRLPLG